MGDREFVQEKDNVRANFIIFKERNRFSES